MHTKRIVAIALGGALAVTGTFFPVAVQAQEIQSVDMFRLYNPNSGEHFYTKAANEKNELVKLGWRDEGTGWKAPVESKTPVYRLYNENAGDHHYTLDENEKNELVKVGWKDEGTGWYSDDTKQVPLYRQYNPNALAGSHNYTTDHNEHVSLVSQGWKDEGIAWYGVDAKTATAPRPSKPSGGSSSGGSSSKPNPSLPDNLTLSLSTSKMELNQGDEGTVYFYATANFDCSQIDLYQKGVSEVIAHLVDDGKYAESGDDLPGDRVYSGKLILDTSADTDYEFYASFALKGLNSNAVTVSVVSELSDEDLDKEAQVDDILQTKLFENDNYDSMTIEERKVLADEVLDSLVSQGLIQADSVEYDDESQSYSFLYADGMSGSVVIKNWDSGMNGTEDFCSGSVLASSYSNSLVRSGANLEATVKNTNPVETFKVGKAVVLWSFDQKWDNADFRRPFYNALEGHWESRGLDTTVNFNATVEDYKKLDGYDVIVFSGHGGYDKHYSKKQSDILLHEKASKDKDKVYSNDRKLKRIDKLSVEGGTMYSILPKFFEDYYSSGKLDGSFVYAENCEFYGKNGNVDDTMAQTILNCSAESVIGFHNSVNAAYSRNLMATYVDQLCAGKTSPQALSNSKSIHGQNDGDKAFPVYRGKPNARLVQNGIINGDFENIPDLSGWSYMGDVRSIGQLGSLKPVKNQKMAILTTGIGSAEQSYLSGTEGSALSQTVAVPSNAKTLHFSYDFVSEEPMEYIGSKFDDTFEVQILSGTGAETLLVESVNSATWTKIDGIDFDGGDETTYHTIWKSVDLDVSKYAGQQINIRFLVYDKGDSIYDSAVLLDDVVLQ